MKGKKQTRTREKKKESKKDAKKVKKTKPEGGGKKVGTENPNKYDT